MADRTELLESALNGLPDGVALLDMAGHVVLWNLAAEAITGYAGMDLLGRMAPEGLEPLLDAVVRPGELEPSEEPQAGRRTLVHARHKLGHAVPTLTRITTLRDGMGQRLGTAILFHPAASLDALPRGECSDCGDIADSQSQFQERLTAEFDDFTRGGLPFGVLWITVDQAGHLRKTHGVGACESMLEKVQTALAQGLRPTEKLGRWGDDEFLVLSHERTPEMLASHAQSLAGLARTADFRWWGDKISLTVSIGAAQADPDGTLVNLLERAKAAMFTSFHAGGNQFTSASGGGQSCLPS
jgi:diguanylate cyclase (GGDEF)-like protein/PAS domain S-box-containing protein